MNNSKKEIAAGIVLLSVFCFMLLALRIYISGRYSFIFLIWNWLLAMIPLILSFIISTLDDKKSINIIFFIILGIAWLLFFPNAPYLITDMVHLKERAIVPLWLDTLMLFSFAFTGLISGLVSLFYVHLHFMKYSGGRFSWFFICNVSILCSYGIYLGRFLRWNSWDIVTNTGTLFDDVIFNIFRSKAILVTGVFTSFMMASYFIVYILLSKKENMNFK
ncbi:hypothetical protein MYP_170 [Sporocytophaga myxococcoides]|uniref:DUF1361 domain-containing protein n=1 Tax=Sporocytophaga myxococcoides TaxID=153721 RepID=A0A098L9A9_9BACT|nr:DUF1361 domain-containing protein [Sporocytophaga myxococcoides]GAL82944.1 hypothetical protein MYP_170 [Sporocytophaga myxococcoides]